MFRSDNSTLCVPFGCVAHPKREAAVSRCFEAGLTSCTRTKAVSEVLDYSESICLKDEAASHPQADQKRPEDRNVPARADILACAGMLRSNSTIKAQQWFSKIHGAINELFSGLHWSIT